MKRLIIGLALIGVAAALTPTLSAADDGAAHTVDTFTEQTNWFGPDECSGVTITGQGTETVTEYVTETSNGGVHERDVVSGSVALYQAKVRDHGIPSRANSSATGPTPGRSATRHRSTKQARRPASPPAGSSTRTAARRGGR